MPLIYDFDYTMSEPISFTSTSASTAAGSPIVLRESTTTRLIYLPLLIENPNNAAAAVKGEFRYQKRSAAREWEDFDTIPLSAMKIGEGYKLVLDTRETLILFEKLIELYSLVSSQGVPMGTTRLVSIPEDEILFRVKEMLDSDQNEPIFSLFLAWAESQNMEQITDFLDSDNGSIIINFDAVIGAARLQNFMNKVESALEVEDESFWQNLLAENSWAISQIYAHPVVIFQDVAYLGGKGFSNSGGTIVDFLYRNALTKNLLIVEIKKPSTSLMNSTEYRNKVHAPSAELSGATLQTLTSRDTLITEFKGLEWSAKGQVKIFNPNALLIIGTLPTDENELRSFELYRNNFMGIEIVTFDELFNKIQLLLDVLQKK